MLGFTKDDIIEHYYDASIFGSNFDRRFSEADARIDSARTLSEMYQVIAGPLLDLQESHTVFIPPFQTTLTRHGWELEMVGDSCFVTAVQPGSDADAKGLSCGTLIHSVNGLTPSRKVLSQLDYSTSVLSPELPVSFTVRERDGSRGEIEVCPAILRQGRAVEFMGETGDIAFANYLRDLDQRQDLRHLRLARVNDELAIWKLPSFECSRKQIDAAMGKLVGMRSVILDLRSNPGGHAVALAYLAGYFFDHDITLCYLDGRSGRDSIVAVHESDSFKGKVFVLVNSKSNSSAEVFAKTMQIQHRGIVLGDVTGGMVSKADYFPRKMGAQHVVSYGSYITTAAITMPDSSRLSGTGVIPDVVTLPRSCDLAEGLDPVLAHAAQMAGVQIDPRRAAELFPIEWR